MENPYAAPQGEIRSPIGSATPLTWKQILFSFRGRIPRRQYWAAHGIQIVVGLVYGFIVGLVTSAAESPGVVLPMLIPLYILSIWVGLAVSAKRCHDRNRSAWFILIVLIPLVGPIWLFVEVACLRGTEGANEYGEDPT